MDRVVSIEGANVPFRGYACTAVWIHCARGAQIRIQGALGKSMSARERLPSLWVHIPALLRTFLAVKPPLQATVNIIRSLLKFQEQSNRHISPS
jgi:hypothetical protein